MTLFPEMFDSPFSTGIFQRAKEKGLVTLNKHNFRDWTNDRHHTVDDTVYGGGAGMVLKPEPLFTATESVIAGIREGGWKGEIPVVLMTPQGRPFCQKLAEKYATRPHIVILCGEYEGVDERIRVHLTTDEISIGDYVLTSGEIAAMVFVNAVTRLIPGVLGSEESAHYESHTDSLLEHPQYTRPAVFRGWKVPDVLLSGNHQEVEKWRREQSVIRTAIRRPDLLKKAALSIKEKQLIEKLIKEGRLATEEECGQNSKY
jgi:tRNA (guanine37-N1)-methyltransferase